MQKADQHMIVLVNIRVSKFRQILNWRNKINNAIRASNCISVRIMKYTNMGWGIHR